MVSDGHLIHQVLERTAQGITALFLRQLILFAVSFAGGIALARLLDPSDFGSFAIVIFFIGLLSSLSGLGLKAALIQHREEPSEKQLRSVFTFHFICVSAILVAVYFLSTFLSQLFHRDGSVAWLIRVMSLVLILDAISTVPHIKLERQLAYGKFAYLDVAKAISYQGLAVLFALFGFQVWSFVWAFLGSSIFGTGLIFYFSPWRIGFAFDQSYLKKSLGFGTLFQIGAMTSLLRDNIAVLLAGPLFGPTAVGFLRWAQDTAFMTSQVFTQIVTRVSFSSLSRLQDYSADLGCMAEKMLRILMLFTIPLLAIITALIPEIVKFVYTDKWIPAIPAFYFYSFRMLGGNITTPLIAVIQALGQVHLSLKILIWWTIFDWALAILMTKFFGFSGVAIAYGVGVWLPVIWLLIEVRKVTFINFWRTIGSPALAGLISWLFIFVVMQRFVSGIMTLALAAIIGLAVYGLMLLLLEGKGLFTELSQGFYLRQSKGPLKA